MSDDKRMVMCDRCKKSVTISEIRYVPVSRDSMIRVCTNCRTKGTTKERSPALAPTAKKNASSSKRISYYCERCNYKFKYDPDSNATLRCPYCAKADKLSEPNEVSAEKLVKEADW